MTTLVGTQNKFEEAVKELFELENDALEAYEAAIERLSSKTHREKLGEFANDHKRHIKELTKLLKDHGEEIPTDPTSGPKGLLAKGKVIIGGLIGDKSILTAMVSNEIDTNTAYERMLKHEDMWSDAKDILANAFQDEKKHKVWLEEHI